MVRAAAARAVAGLALVLGPAPVLQALGGALVHQQWRVREEGVNAYIAALLTHAKERFDYPACVHALAAAADDDTPRVAAAALEAFALLHARLGALLQGLLTAVGAAEGVKRRVAERARATPQLGLPTLDAQGQVQHQVGKCNQGDFRVPSCLERQKDAVKGPPGPLLLRLFAGARPASQRTSAKAVGICRCSAAGAGRCWPSATRWHSRAALQRRADWTAGLATRRWRCLGI